MDDVGDDLRPDIAAAAARMRLTSGGERELRGLEWVLRDDETVERMATGMYGRRVGLLALTDRRLLFLRRGRLSQTIEDHPVDRITSIQWHTAVLSGTLTVYTAGRRAVITNVQKDDGRDLADSLRALLTRRAAADDVIERIRRLGELHDAGVLTDEEFAAKKAELLRRL